MAKFRAFFRKYLLGSDVADSFFESGYVIGEVVACTLRQCGDDLSRENIMRQTLHLDGLGSPVLLPEIKMGTTPTENDPLHQFQLCTFRRKTWMRFGEIPEQPLRQRHQEEAMPSEKCRELRRATIEDLLPV